MSKHADSYLSHCNCWFVKPIRSSESGLPLVGLLDSNIVVSPPNIQFSKISGMLQSVNKVRDTGERVGILDGMRVDITVILAGAEHPILLRDKEEGRCLRELQGKDLSLFQILVNEHL